MLTLLVPLQITLFPFLGALPSSEEIMCPRMCLPEGLILTGYIVVSLKRRQEGGCSL